MLELLTTGLTAALLIVHIYVTRRNLRELRKDILRTTRGARQARGVLLEKPEYSNLDVK